MFIKETFLVCDICHENFGADNRTEGKSAAAIRAEKDWHRSKGRDVCYVCFESGKHKEATDE